MVVSSHGSLLVRSGLATMKVVGSYPGKGEFWLKRTEFKLSITVYMFLLLYVHSRGKWFSPLPSTKAANSLSHSPLPVLPFLSCMGRYVTVVLFCLSLGFKKPNSLLLSLHRRQGCSSMREDLNRRDLNVWCITCSVYIVCYPLPFAPVQVPIQLLL